MFIVPFKSPKNVDAVTVPVKVAFCELSIDNATVPLALLECVANSNVGVPSLPSLAPLKDIP